jgi:hypothetical protein
LIGHLRIVELKDSLSGFMPLVRGRML